MPSQTKLHFPSNTTKSSITLFTFSSITPHRHRFQLLLRHGGYTVTGSFLAEDGMAALSVPVIRFLIMIWFSLILQSHAVTSHRNFAIATTAKTTDVTDGDYIGWKDVLIQGKNVGNVEVGLDGRQVRVLVVAGDGTGDSRTVQGAIDMVPDGNGKRVLILIRPGVYREKVLVPATKPYISFLGNKTEHTVITWNATASDRDSKGQILGTFFSASVAVESDYFAASWITFQNTAPAAEPGAEGKQAVALRVSGDKAMFYKCKVLGSQDTLFDHVGRHYFYKCRIEGAIDFIFGNGRSLYEECELRVTAASYGAVAASQRNSASENSGFSFLKCRLRGSGSVYLGRAWGRYAMVVYAFCDLGSIIIPQGWYDWGDPSRRGTVWFAEYQCKGEGSDPKGRVDWSKSLTSDEATPFLSRVFIDGQHWLKL